MSERRPPSPEDPSSATPETELEAAERETSDAAGLTRRNLLRWGALAGAAAPFAALPPRQANAASVGDAAVALEEATIAQLQAAMTAGGLNSLGLVNLYIERIAALDENGPALNSILEVNPDHPAVRNLAEIAKDPASEARVADLTNLLYDQALVAEGSPPSDPVRFARQVADLLASAKG